jgi:hypothetical protein
MSNYYGYIEDCPCGYCEQEKAREKADQEAASAAPVSKVKEVPTSRTLTREMLLKYGPCYEYRNRFTERFPVSVEVTLELALSQIEDWDWYWAGDYLLSRTASSEFSKRTRAAEDVYHAEVKPYNELAQEAWTKYYDVRDAAKTEARTKGLNYQERYALMDKASKGLLDVAQAAQTAAIEVAGKRQNEAIVRAFVELFLADGEEYEKQHKNDVPYNEPEDDDTYQDGYYDED